MLNELLLRFRSVGVPGAAGAPAVPGEALDAELAPVFALFEASEREADAIDEEAGKQVEASQADASARISALVGEAHAKSSDEQAAEAAVWFARADATCADLHAKAAAEVSRIDAVVPQRLAPLITEVVGRVLTSAGMVAQP